MIKYENRTDIKKSQIFYLLNMSFMYNLLKNV